jgi:hypothetical protein
MSIVKLARKIIVDTKHMAKDDKTFRHIQSEVKELLADDVEELKKAKGKHEYHKAGDCK